MKKIIVSEITRPSLHIQELKQTDGSFLPGEHYWAAVDFVVLNQERSDVVGKYDRLRLQLDYLPAEVWEFFNAVVMLFPKPNENPNHYILTYDGVQRVSGNLGEQ